MINPEDRYRSVVIGHRRPPPAPIPPPVIDNAVRLRGHRQSPHPALDVVDRRGYLSREETVEDRIDRLAQACIDYSRPYGSGGDLLPARMRIPALLDWPRRRMSNAEIGEQAARMEMEGEQVLRHMSWGLDILRMAGPAGVLTGAASAIYHRLAHGAINEQAMVNATALAQVVDAFLFARPIPGQASAAALSNLPDTRRATISSPPSETKLVMPKPGAATKRIDQSSSQTYPLQSQAGTPIYPSTPKHQALFKAVGEYLIETATAKAKVLGVRPDVAKASGALQSPGSPLSKSSPTSHTSHTSPTSKFENRTFVDALGNRVIQSELTIDRTRKRKDFQNDLFPSVQVGLRGWQKAHSQGLITHSPESAEAIRYAPEEVNQVFQRLGIERYIRELVEQLKPQGVRLWLTTATATHWGTLRLKEIQYRVDGIKDGVHVTLFETSIEVANTKVNPRVTIKGDPRSSSR